MLLLKKLLPSMRLILVLVKLAFDLSFFFFVWMHQECVMQEWKIQNSWITGSIHLWCETLPWYSIFSFLQCYLSHFKEFLSWSSISIHVFISYLKTGSESCLSSHFQILNQETGLNDMVSFDIHILIVIDFEWLPFISTGLFHYQTGLYNSFSGCIVKRKFM